MKKISVALQLTNEVEARDLHEPRAEIVTRKKRTRTEAFGRGVEAVMKGSTGAVEP